MSKIIVVGGGPIGMATGTLFAREGHEVSVLEKDEQSPPATALEAAERWERNGVAQFRQVHGLHAKVRHILDEEFPGVRDELLASGGRRFNPIQTMPHTIEDRSSRPDDDQFETISARRVVFENVFARATENVAGVKIIRGLTVAGPVTKGTVNGVPHVVGVRTSAGETMTADLVIDAMGRKSKFPEWMEQISARAPIEEISETGFAYFTRHYRSADGSLPEFRGFFATFLSTMVALTMPADNGTWAIALVPMANDHPLKAIRNNDVFERVVRAIPPIAHWVDAEPVHDVVPMAGAMDRYRRFVVDGKPVVSGLVAVGDSWACTNPTAGRGISLGLAHAVALRNVAKDCLDDPYNMAVAFDQVTEEHLTPWYQNQRQRDVERTASVRLAIEGKDPPAVDDSNFIAKMQAAFWSATFFDPDVFRAMLETLSVLSLPQQIMTRPGMMEKVMGASAGKQMAEPPLSREKLLEVVSAA